MRFSVLHGTMYCMSSFIFCGFRINNCVGEDNHYAFLQLTVYAALMSGWVFIMLMLDFYYWPQLQNIPVSKTTNAERTNAKKKHSETLD